VGEAFTSEEVEMVDHQPLLRQISTSHGTTGGCSGDLSTVAYLTKFAWTKIVRHAMVLGTTSPDDPNLVHYWTNRHRKQPPPPLGALVLGLLKTQKCRCAFCGDMLLHTDEQPQSPHEWEQWLRTTRMAIRKQHIVAGVGGQDDQRLIHASCRRRIDGTAHQHD
jgi:RNA-directed DNA polymerase